VKAFAIRRIRRWLLSWSRAEPKEINKGKVTFLVMTAYAMGGTVRVTWNLASHLAAAGYEVEILSVRREQKKPFFGEPPPGVSIRAFSAAGPAPLRWFLTRRNSLLMHPADKSFKGFSLWADIQLVRALRRRTGFLITTRPGLNLLATKIRAPGLVVIGQENMNLREHSEELQAAMAANYKRLAVLTVLTKRDKERYRELLGPGRPRIVRVRNSVRDMGGVRADLEAKTVLAAGRFARQKGFDRLIQTWDLLAPRQPEWRLRILGEGPWQEKLEAMIEARGLTDSVTLEGPTENLGAEMAQASIFVLSSRWEGLPLVLLEAMSVGMAVVAFNAPTGPADVIRDHRNGLLIRPRTIANLADGLDEMMSDVELRRSCATAAMQTAERFRMDAVGAQWERLLERTWQRSRFAS
jgi:glycosyltransferase involved in cell wall biosynthesis